MTLPPITTVWDAPGFCWRPLPRYHNLLGDRLGDGEVMDLVEHHDRSSASHNHSFAWLKEAWLSLPEDQAERFPSPEHLRKWALCRGGYADERSIVCGSKAEAQRVAAFIKPMDDYAIVTVREAVVTVYTAKSQSYRAMGKADFQASKDAVLRIVADLIGTDPETLSKQQEAA